MDPAWSQSTIVVFCNEKLLFGIHTVKTKLYIKCNAGVKTTILKEHLSGYDTVWHFPDGIANILSLSQLNKWFRVTHDSATDDAFHVHKPQKLLVFKKAAWRLYYFDIADMTYKSTVLVQTVDNKKAKFSAFN